MCVYVTRVSWKWSWTGKGWKLNPSPLEEQPILLTVKPPLLPEFCFVLKSGSAVVHSGLCTPFPTLIVPEAPLWWGIGVLYA